MTFHDYLDGYLSNFEIVEFDRNISCTACIIKDNQIFLANSLSTSTNKQTIIRGKDHDTYIVFNDIDCTLDTAIRLFTLALLNEISLIPIEVSPNNIRNISLYRNGTLRLFFDNSYINICRRDEEYCWYEFYLYEGAIHNVKIAISNKRLIVHNYKELDFIPEKYTGDVNNILSYLKGIYCNDNL